MNIRFYFLFITIQFLMVSFCYAQETWDSSEISQMNTLTEGDYTLLVSGVNAAKLQKYRGTKLFSEQVFDGQTYPVFASLITPEKPDVFYLTGLIIKAPGSNIVATRAWDTHKVWNHYGSPIIDQIISYSNQREIMTPNELIKVSLADQEVKGHNEVMIYPLEGDLDKARIVGIYLYTNEYGEKFEGLDYEEFEDFARKHNLPIFEFRASRKIKFLDFKTPSFHHLNAPRLYKIRREGLTCKSILSIK